MSLSMLESHLGGNMPLHIELEELNIKQVSEIIGISENQIYKNFKSYIKHLNDYDITFEGKGKKRKFYKIVNYNNSNAEIAYETFKLIIFNVWKFNRKINIDKLLYYMAMILYNQNDETHDSVISSKEFASIIDLDEETISKYKYNLIKNKVIAPKDLSKMVTYISTIEKEIPLYSSRLIPNKNNIYNKINQESSLDEYKYQVKVEIRGILKQHREDRILVDNEVYENYINCCKYIANSPYIKEASGYIRVKSMIENNEMQLSVNAIDRYKAFKEFQKELGIDKLWCVYKTEYTYSFMKNKILLDIIAKSYIYRYPDSIINDKLLEYSIVEL